MNLQVLDEAPPLPVTDVPRPDRPVFGQGRSDDRPAVMVAPRLTRARW